jgi:transglutaminase-like putative cysteine protease
MPRAVALAGGLCLLLLVIGSAGLSQSSPVRNPKAYQVTYRVTVTNVSCQMDTLEIYVPFPVNWDSQKDVSLQGTLPSASSAYADPVYGNGIYYWQVASPPSPGSSVTVTEVFTYTAYDVTYAVDPSQVGSYDVAGELYKTYTRSEDKIEAGHPDIQSAAAAIVGGETNPYRKAEQIYAWVLEHMAYVPYDGFHGALESLHQGWGECGDYAYLFCALLRAAGVPARPVAGFHAVSGCSPHVWAEFFLPSYGWIPADPSWDDVSGPPWRYFGEVPSSTRLICSKGANIELAPSRVADLFQVYYWWWTGTGGEAYADCTLTVAEIPLGTPSAFRVSATGDAFADQSFFGRSFESGFADVAEWVPVSEVVAAGALLQLDPVHPGSYRLSQGSCSDLVAGVVSSEPGVVLGGTESSAGKALLAITGIVPVKVTNEGGPIWPGDLLVSSSTPGYAMRWEGPDPSPCALVGKALEPMMDERGVILVLLTAH